jgi:stage V sporulation protein D (sporulation-specific penicillin-binding protein)
METPFVCSGSLTVGGRVIKCWRSPRSHGAQTFIQGVQNSCNPVFMIVGEQLGAELFHSYLMRFGFHEKTGVDLPGEAVGIMYAADKIGPVELATMAFGQSLTITPLQLVRAAAATVNGGFLVTPHVGARIVGANGETVRDLTPARGEQILPSDVSETLNFILESVVSVGTGHRTFLPGYRVGAKTATSQKLPRGSGLYISSIMAFAPADAPRVVALVLVDEPQGAYYGGQVTGPVMQILLENVLPHLDVTPVYTTEADLDAAPIAVPAITHMPRTDAIAALQQAGLNHHVTGSGNTVIAQFPPAGERINPGMAVILHLR